ncbi:MAG: OFA family MFS transporter [Sedimentisphaerales bacterium]|nr:OFA family MFS transporter [Sedimentisphaerales bacterium]
MSEQNPSAKVMNRWIVVVGAILIQLCLGAIYAWSVFTVKLTDNGIDGAMNHYKHMLKVSPNEPRALLALGDVFLAKGITKDKDGNITKVDAETLKEAQKHYQLLLDAKPDWKVLTEQLHGVAKSPDSLEGVLWAIFTLGADQPGTLETMVKSQVSALDTLIEDPKAKVPAGILQYSDKKADYMDKTIGYLMQQVRKNPDDINTHFRLGVALQQAGGYYRFNKKDTQIIFSVGLAMFAIVMALIAGRWQKKVGPKVVALTGGLVLGAGYVLAGLSGNSFTGILIGVGILGGAGIGLGYVCPIAALAKWFPDKKGLIMGLAVAGFGFGALIWIKLTGGFKFGPLDLTPGWTGLYGAWWSVNQVFILYGILFAVLVGLGAMTMVNPPAGWQPAGWTPPTGESAAKTGGIDFSEKQMVGTFQFWILFLTFTAGAMAGLMVIGIIKLFGIDALTANGIDATKANVITGTAMGLFYALFNGFGRIAWGYISGKTGAKNAIVLMSALQGAMMLLFYFIGGNQWGLYLGAAVIGFNFGGNFALFPTATSDLFGNKNVGTNYPWVFMAYAVGGIVGPILGGIMGDIQAWKGAFIPAGIACLAMAALATQLKPPRAPELTTYEELKVK